MEITNSELAAVGIQVTTKSDSYPAVRMLLPYSESVCELLRKALTICEAGLAAKQQQEDVAK